MDKTDYAIIEANRKRRGIEIGDTRSRLCGALERNNREDKKVGIDNDFNGGGSDFVDGGDVVEKLRK